MSDAQEKLAQRNARRALRLVEDAEAEKQFIARCLMGATAADATIVGLWVLAIHWASAGAAIGQNRSGQLFAMVVALVMVTIAALALSVGLIIELGERASAVRKARRVHEEALDEAGGL